MRPFTIILHSPAPKDAMWTSFSKENLEKTLDNWHLRDGQAAIIRQNPSLVKRIYRHGPVPAEDLKVAFEKLKKALKKCRVSDRVEWIWKRGQMNEVYLAKPL